ncbi:MAG: putative molybdenum carrier protein [Bacteroidales bacterium]|nr:putative molybdenum carrier protein [Bacteroidales bacterium]
MIIVKTIQIKTKRSKRHEVSPYGSVWINKIISGGQTGVDRAALDFAIKNNISCGGMCPKGRLAEDGKISEKYLLSETSTSEYTQRTIENVKLSDGTLILFKDEMGKGTRLTLETARKLNRPFLSINLDRPDKSVSLKSWIKNLQIKILNIAGPRESNQPGIYLQTIKFLEKHIIYL